MRVVYSSNEYAIAKGAAVPSFFSFYVNDDSSAWSQSRYNARGFQTKAQAEEGIQELRRRDRLKQERRKQAWLRSQNPRLEDK